MSRTKTLWIREPYLSQILAGRKTVEVRVGYDNLRQLQPGDRLKLNDQHPVTIRRISQYADFEELLAHEDPPAIAPDLPAGGLLSALRELYAPEKEALGAVAIEVICPPLAEESTSRRYEAVLFDMGHTLVYFEPAEEVIVQAALRAAGAERTTDEILAAVRLAWREYYQDATTATFPATEEYDRAARSRQDQSLLAHLGLGTEPEVLGSYAAAVEVAFSRQEVIRAFPEATPVLTTLREQGYRLGIVSNWGWNLRDRVLQAGLDGFFEIVWASAYAGCNKPHPGIFHQALEQMGVSAGSALYVGDAYKFDVVGARNAGVEAVLLDRKSAAQDPDCPVIRDLWGLFDLLR